MRSVTIGLRLCGIADEPFWAPVRNGSSTSRTSVRCRWRISVAKRSRPAPASAIALSSSAWRSRGTTWVETGSRREPEPLQHGGLDLGAVGGVGADRAGERAEGGALDGALEPAQVAVRLEGEAGELDAERRGLGVHAVRAPDAERVDVLARAPDQRVAVVALRR